MGAYLSQPVTEKISKDDGNELLKFGASSMQGWRTSQEDAHTCLLNFDENTSLFAVFDGHGGAEVAQYCARHLPIFLKNLEEYKAGDLKSALEKAFLEFDKLLIDPSVIEELKKLAGSEYVASGEEEDEEDVNESSRLREEAEIPIEDLLARYSSTSSKDSGIVAPSNEVKKDNIPSHLKEEALKTKPISPYLRAKPGPSSSSSGAPSSSKSCCSSSTSSDPEASNRFEPCSSSSSSSSSLPNGRIPWSSRQKVGSENDSVSSSVSETVDEKNEMCRVSSTRTSEIRESDKCDSNVSESCDVVCADASNSLNECDSKPSNGETCQEKESCVSTSTDATPMKKSTDSGGCNDTSSTSIDEPTSSSKGKGKKKKVVPTKVNTPACSASSVYQAFLNDFAEDEFDSEDEFRVTSESSEEVGSEEDEEEEEEVSSDEDSDEEEDLSPYAFLSHSGDYEEQPGKDSGCTAVVAILKGNQLYVANAGDSRCVFSRRGRAIDMSLDHKPEDPLERRRVENAGGKVTADGRINGGLNLSRAIGDHAYKSNTDLELKDQMITAFPDIKRVTIKPERDEFMVLACDGIWNSMTSQEVVNFVRERLGKKSLSEICEDLFNDCLSPNTDGDGTGCDNMTCVIVQFCDIKPLDSQKDMEDSDGEQDKAEYQPSIVDVVKAHYKRGEGSSPERSETGPSQKRVKTE